MTEGEKMIWAIAYMHALLHVEPKGMASKASDYANVVVNQLRFAGRGEFWGEMVDAPPELRHPANPCE